MTGEHAAEMIEIQAAACAELGSPLYGALLPRVAEDVRAGGVCAEALAGYLDAPGPDAIALRLAGGVHALALTGRAPALAAHYPSAGGRYRPEDADAVWRAFRDTVAREMALVRDWMTRPPQTNEVGRANLLLTGLLYAMSEQPRPVPVRLFELGASAGLNLRADGFRATAPGFSWGPEDSPVRLTDAWRGPVPEWLAEAARRFPALEVTERQGCDISPVDPMSADGALALRAYVWPDRTARAARLEGALRLAEQVPAPPVRHLGAAEFLADVEPVPGALTVVWHSVMRQYVPADEWARAEAEMERLAEASGPEAPVARVSFEPRRRGSSSGPSHPFLLSVRLGTGEEQFLAEAHPHGLPARALE